MTSLGRTLRPGVAVVFLSGLTAVAVARGLPVERDSTRTRVVQEAPGRQPGGPPPPEQAKASDSDAVARGLVLYGFYCMNCHGGDGRGGRDGGSDLRESEMLTLDDGGKAFAEFLPVGRPEQRMPATPLPEADIADLWAFVRVLVADPDKAGGGAITGDAAAGARHYKSSACADCHSATGDLAKIGSRHDVKAIHARLLEPPAPGAAAKAHPGGADAARRGHVERVKALPEQTLRDLAVYLASLK